MLAGCRAPYFERARRAGKRGDVGRGAGDFDGRCRRRSGFSDRKRRGIGCIGSSGELFDRGGRRARSTSGNESGTCLLVVTCGAAATRRYSERLPSPMRIESPILRAEMSSA